MHLTFPKALFWVCVLFLCFPQALHVVLIHERKLVRLDPTATVVDGGLNGADPQDPGILNHRGKPWELWY